MKRVIMLALLSVFTTSAFARAIFVENVTWVPVSYGGVQNLKMSQVPNPIPAASPYYRIFPISEDQFGFIEFKFPDGGYCTEAVFYKRVCTPGDIHVCDNVETAALVSNVQPPSPYWCMNFEDENRTNILLSKYSLAAKHANQSQ